MTDRALLQQALEALRFGLHVGFDESSESQIKKSGKAFDQHSKAITALRERLADASDGWQPIETAPKTGRKVILFYLNRNHLPRTVMARWLTDEEAAETDADGVGLEGGWYECIDNWDDYTEVAIHEGEPTHWMPLPAAPQQGDKP